ncbi:beta-galactosidase [Planctomycetota bacterium]
MHTLSHLVILLSFSVGSLVVWANNSETIGPIVKKGDYPFWRDYHKTPIEEMIPQVWRTTDDIIDGWDWSLPPAMQPCQNSLLCVRRSFNTNKTLEGRLPTITAPINPVVSLWVRWREIEPVEGAYNFDIIRDRMREAEAAGYGVILRLHTSATVFAPSWIADYQVPIRKEHKKSKMTNYEVSHPAFHARYLKLVTALGHSGIPHMDVLKGAFVGYASPSNGDEGIGPHGVDPDTVPHVLERLDAWAKAFKGLEHKVFMGGLSNYGFELGFGTRRGFVEMYLYTIPDATVGQLVDNQGYLWLDESASVIANQVFHGEENEEYEEKWATAQCDFRFGKTTDSYPYRYFTANLRLLQMRCNYVLNNEFSLLPEQLIWVGQSLGRTIEDTPDVWCFLRESYLASNKYKAIYGTKTPSPFQQTGIPVKNFERWLYQRDSQDAVTQPSVKITHPIEMWMVQKGKYYDYMARSGKKIGFAVDDRWLKRSTRRQRCPVAIKVTYFDCGTSGLSVNYQTPEGKDACVITLTNTNTLKTATFFVEDIVFNAEGVDYDITVTGFTDPAVVSFMRIIKL